MFDIAKLGRMDFKKFLVVFSRLNFLFLFGCTCGCIFLKLAKLFFLFLNCLFLRFRKCFVFPHLHLTSTIVLFICVLLFFPFHLFFSSSLKASFVS